MVAGRSVTRVCDGGGLVRVCVKGNQRCVTARTGKVVRRKEWQKI